MRLNSVLPSSSSAQESVEVRSDLSNEFLPRSPEELGRRHEHGVVGVTFDGNQDIEHNDEDDDGIGDEEACRPGPLEALGLVEIIQKHQVEREERRPDTLEHENRRRELVYNVLGDRHGKHDEEGLTEHGSDHAQHQLERAKVVEDSAQHENEGGDRLREGLGEA